MCVDTRISHSGAKRSGFPAAKAFDDAVGEAHIRQVRSLGAHHETLTTIGGKAHWVAPQLRHVDERDATRLRAVRCSCAT
jgi:hypothetical protein